VLYGSALVKAECKHVGEIDPWWTLLTTISTKQQKKRQQILSARNQNKMSLITGLSNNNNPTHYMQKSRDFLIEILYIS